MDTKDLLYVENENQQKLYYHFTPAAVSSNFVPLVIIFNNVDRPKITNFEYKMWNILTPLYFTGDSDEIFTRKELLESLITQVVEEYECEDHIYLYGNRMGGYEAILHGILCKANALYVQSPTIRLNKTKDKDAVKDQLRESDLSNLLNDIDSFPIFFIAYDMPSAKNETLYFTETCKKYGIKFRQDFTPVVSDNESDTIKKVLDMFEHVASQV